MRLLDLAHEYSVVLALHEFGTVLVMEYAPHGVLPRLAQRIVCRWVFPPQAPGEALGSHLRRAIREAAKHHDTEQPADKSTGDVEEQWYPNSV